MKQNKAVQIQFGVMLIFFIFSGLAFFWLDKENPLKESPARKKGIK
jgi:hypothetical protein